MKKLILLLILSVSLYAEFKVMFYGVSQHCEKKYTKETTYISAYTGETIYKQRTKHTYNSEHNLLGFEYAFKEYSASIVTYKNSYYKQSNAIYISKLWKNSGLKLSLGIVSGYNYKNPSEFRPMIMPSYQKAWDNFELEVGLLGEALTGIIKYKF